MNTEQNQKRNVTNKHKKMGAPFPIMINGKVEVFAKDGKRLMPCEPVVARLLLKQKKAKITSKKPFTIRLKYATETEYMQKRNQSDVDLIESIENAKKEYQRAKKNNAKSTSHKTFKSTQRTNTQRNTKSQPRSYGNGKR